MSEALQQAAELIDAGAYPDALSALDPVLEDNPDDPRALHMMGVVLLESGKPALAYQLYRRASELEPDRHQVWINLGQAADELKRYDEAERYFLKALELDSQNYLALSNLATIAVHRCEPKSAIKWAKRALKVQPQAPNAHHNYGFAKLLLKDYSGWEHYEYGLGRVRWREEKDYGLPRWDGSPGKSVVVYAEQGIGDQIAMAGAFNDIKKDCNVALDVAPKLKGLFARSFGVETHGDQFVESSWAEGRMDAKCAMSSLQKFYRNTVGSYDGKPYLKADPQRRLACRALLDSLGDKPKVGISWTGGMKETGASLRSTALEQLLPILDADVTWVSLEYKDRSEEIAECPVEIHDFPWLTQTNDYDDTAALVAELDLVISVPQSVVHLAGGLGTDCWVMQTHRPHFLFGLEGETPLYSSVKQYRRKDTGWAAVITRIANDLRRRYAVRNSGARRAGP